MCPSNSSGSQLMADAVTALTTAVRLVDGPDFAEFATLAITAAVANFGGTESALVRSSGSREAACVRDMVNSSVGDDVALLLEHRTEPMSITVRPDEVLNDLGYWRLSDDEDRELERRYDAPGFRTRRSCRMGRQPVTPRPGPTSRRLLLTPSLFSSTRSTSCGRTT